MVLSQQKSPSGLNPPADLDVEGSNEQNGTKGVVEVEEEAAKVDTKKVTLAVEEADLEEDTYEARHRVSYSRIASAGTIRIVLLIRIQPFYKYGSGSATKGGSP